MPRRFRQSGWSGTRRYLGISKPCRRSTPALETQLHHIDGLSEHFVYFNDNFFLGRLCTPEDFFWDNGVLKFLPSSHQRVAVFDIDDAREEYLIADRNAINLLAGTFGRCGRGLMQHIPYPSSRSNSIRSIRSSSIAARSNRSCPQGTCAPITFMQYYFGFLNVAPCRPA